MSTTKAPKAVRYGAWPYDQHAGAMAEALNRELGMAWRRFQFLRSIYIFGPVVDSKRCPPVSMELADRVALDSAEIRVKALCSIRRAGRTGK